MELPQFLTKELALEAMGNVARFVTATFPTKRTTFHIVILVPQMDYSGDRYPNCPIAPHLLAEYSHDRQGAWSRDYDDIAQCKALQLWHDRNDGGTDTKPHLLIRGDTPYWGGVKRDGIVVACSGVESYFDRMIAGMVADTCIALSYRNYLTWRAENPEEDFTCSPSLQRADLWSARLCFLARCAYQVCTTSNVFPHQPNQAEIVLSDPSQLAR